jgi:hypothetical protein
VKKSRFAFLNSFAVASLMGVLLLSGSLVYANTENEARAIDYNAYVAKKAALSTFGGIVSKSVGTPQEPEYLIRYAQMAQETGAVEYRLAYGKAKPGVPADLTEYKRLMASSRSARIHTSRACLCRDRTSGLGNQRFRVFCGSLADFSGCRCG